MAFPLFFSQGTLTNLNLNGSMKETSNYLSNGENQQDVLLNVKNATE